MRTSIRIIMPIVAMIVVEVIFSMRIFIVSIYPTFVVLQTYVLFRKYLKCELKDLLVLI